MIPYNTLVNFDQAVDGGNADLHVQPLAISLCSCESNALPLSIYIRHAFTGFVLDACLRRPYLRSILGTTPSNALVIPGWGAKNGVDWGLELELVRWHDNHSLNGDPETIGVATLGQDLLSTLLQSERGRVVIPLTNEAGDIRATLEVRISLFTPSVPALSPAIQRLVVPAASARTLTLSPKLVSPLPPPVSRSTLFYADAAYDRPQPTPEHKSSAGIVYFSPSSVHAAACRGVVDEMLQRRLEKDSPPGTVEQIVDDVKDLYREVVYGQANDEEQEKLGQIAKECLEPAEKLAKRARENAPHRMVSTKAGYWPLGLDSARFTFQSRPLLDVLRPPIEYSSATFPEVEFAFTTPNTAHTRALWLNRHLARQLLDRGATTTLALARALVGPLPILGLRERRQKYILDTLVRLAYDCSKAISDQDWPKARPISLPTHPLPPLPSRPRPRAARPLGNRGLTALEMRGVASELFTSRDGLLRRQLRAEHRDKALFGSLPKPTPSTSISETLLAKEA